MKQKIVTQKHQMSRQIENSKSFKILRKIAKFNPADS
jgi:hypothetical protein